WERCQVWGESTHTAWKKRSILKGANHDRPSREKNRNILRRISCPDGPTDALCTRAATSPGFARPNVNRSAGVHLAECGPENLADIAGVEARRQTEGSESPEALRSGKSCD